MTCWVLGYCILSNTCTGFVLAHVSGFWFLGASISDLLDALFWFGVLVSMEWSCLGSGFWWFTFWVLGSWFLDMESWFWVVLSWFWVLGCLFLVLGSGLFVLGSGINAL